MGTAPLGLARRPGKSGLCTLCGGIPPPRAELQLPLGWGLQPPCGRLGQKAKAAPVSTGRSRADFGWQPRI